MRSPIEARPGIRRTSLPSRIQKDTAAARRSEAYFFGVRRNDDGCSTTKHMGILRSYHPLMQAIDFNFATFLAIPASCITCTTSCKFLYASGISSPKVPLLEAITKTP